jgi:EpsI family protein
MTSRRDVLLGGLFLAASGTAYALTPSRKVALLAKDAKLAQLVPTNFAGWSEIPNDSLVVPEGDDSLAARLYSETVGRIYRNTDNEVVMMLIAYGDTQSDQLQLHRPEVCYPAFGFEVVDAHAVPIPVAPAVVIPGRRMLARADLRREHVLYWTRIGEHLPTSASQQRWMKLRTEMSGVIADGVLVRLSNLAANEKAGYDLNRRFASNLVNALSVAGQRALVGTALAQQLA